MDDDFFRRDYDQSSQGHDNLFAWTVFILLLIGFALACWLGSFYVFGHPENPRSYKILLRLKKLEPPKRFELTSAPPGEFLTPQKIYEKYATMPDYQLQQENAELLRNYIRNYQDTKKLVPYVIGRFTILNSYVLKAQDLFSSGVVALSQAADYPQLLVEHVYTANSSSVQQLQRMLNPGLDLKLEKTLDLSAIIHIGKLDDGRLQLTAVPLLYGTYALKQGSGSFSLEPPPGLHLEAGVPIIKPSNLPPARKAYAVNQAPTPSTESDSDASPSPSESSLSPELVRVMAPVAVTPPTSKRSASQKSAALAVATPASSMPVPPPTQTPVPLVVASPTPMALAENVTPAPLPTVPLIAPAVRPEEILPPSTPPPAPGQPNVPLQPFLAAKATPPMTTTTGSWKVFHPGQMPRGKLVRVNDAADLADRGVSGERLYLSGQFVVTASGENRAVLRAKGGLLNALNPLERSASSSTRILVEFPTGYQPPTEGSNFSRDAMRPFEVRDVERARDGTINVYVREITTPE